MNNKTTSGMSRSTKAKHSVATMSIIVQHGDTGQERCIENGFFRNITGFSDAPLGCEIKSNQSNEAGFLFIFFYFQNVDYDFSMCHSVLSLLKC